MTASDSQWDVIARRYRLGEQAEWRKLLTHFKLTSGFDFVVLLVADNDGALLCRHELEKQFEESGHSLFALDIHTPEDLRRLPEWFLDLSCPPDTTCLWLQGVAPDYTQDYVEWRGAWQNTLARLNTFRNPIREKFDCTLLFAGAPWLQEVLRETAPDLWSVRTTVVTIETALSINITGDGNVIGNANVVTINSSADPKFALQRAERLRGVSGKELELATLLYRAGEGLAAYDEWREVEKVLNEALEIQQRHNAPSTDLLETLEALAWTYHLMGQSRHTLELSEQALDLAREIGARWHEGNALNNLGLAWLGLGETDRAIEYFKQYLATSREIGNRHDEGNALGNLGSAYFALGEPQRAIEYNEQKLAIVREIGNRLGESNGLGNLGNAYNLLGDLRRAIEYYEQQLELVREIGDRRGEGNALGNLGITYKNLGETQRAIEYYEQSLNLKREIGDQRGEANSLWNMGLTLDELGQRARSVELAAAALTIFEQIEDPFAETVRGKLEEWRAEVADDRGEIL